MKITVERMDHVKALAKKICLKLNDDEMMILRGQINTQRILRENKRPADHFVCPITTKILKRVSGVKVVTKIKVTKSCTSSTWLLISRKANALFTKRYSK